MKLNRGTYKALLCVMVCLLSAGLYAQRNRESEEKVIADLMERYIENQETTLDYTDLQEQLEYYMKNKLNLNRASEEELQRLFFLDERDVNAILKHRQEFGDFIAIYELQAIDLLDERTLHYLSYFVTTEEDMMADQTPFMQMTGKGKHELIALHENDFQQRRGYESYLADEGKMHYLGSPYRYVLRYRFGYSNRLSFGYTGEKDRGEQFFKGAQKSGFDFNSFHFLYRPSKGKIKAVALGDYQVNFGQGLVFGSGIAPRKSAYVLSVRRNYQTIRPYRSLNENEFLRGGALTIQHKQLELTTFGSYKYISTDYRAAADTIPDEEAVFSSIQVSGLHRTTTEVLNRHNILQKIIGGHIEWRTDDWKIGFTAVQTNYDKSFQPGHKPYQLYQFRGNSLTNLGVDYSFQVLNVSFFGEAGRSSNHAYAITSGMMIPMDEKLDMVVVYRNFAPGYQTTFNNPFAENSDGRNEVGVYTGVSYRFSRRWVLNTYFDMYHSPWLRYLVDGPSKGYDFLTELQFNPSRTTQLYIRFRHEDKTKNQSGNVERVDYLASTVRDVYRLHVQYRINTSFSGKSRIEHSQYFDELNKYRSGTLVFQDISYTTPLRKLTLTGRMAIFSIEDYNARIYATESDVLYQYSVPLYQNSGVRYYLITKYSIARRLDVWIKYGQTIYSNINVVSSGLEQINGNTQSDMRVQIRWSF